MFTHVVILNPKPETTPEEIATAMEHVQQLKAAIPGIISIETGNNRSPNSKGYTHGFVIYFQDEEHFKAYPPHPAHQPVSEELQRLCQGIIDFDMNNPKTEGVRLSGALKTAYQAFRDGWNKEGEAPNSTEDQV